MAVTPFQIVVPSETLDDLQARLSRTRWTEGVDGDGWAYGTDPRYLRELCTYWQKEFNWRKQEEQLNSFNHFRADVDGLGIHFIHERGKGKDPLPIILTHGYPDSFVRVGKWRSGCRKLAMSCLITHDLNGTLRVRGRGLRHRSEQQALETSITMRAQND